MLSLSWHDYLGFNLIYYETDAEKDNRLDRNMMDIIIFNPCGQFILSYWSRFDRIGYRISQLYWASSWQLSLRLSSISFSYPMVYNISPH